MKKLKRSILSYDANQLMCDPNISLKLAEHLIAIGITSISTIKEFGSKNTWLKLYQAGKTDEFNHLCALEGVCRHIHRNNMMPDVIEDLQKYYQSVIG